MINIRHTKNYGLKIRSNKVEYITVAGVYCTTHDVKVPFCMSGFLSSNIINHFFHIDNEIVRSVIGYDIIIDGTDRPDRLI